MTFTHDDIKNRLVEFLYGELEGDARAAFDAHVAGCPGCRGDVDELRRTRELARAAVRAGLEQPVPLAVHARILEAAAAAAAQAATATTRGAKTTAKTTAKKADGGGGAPWAWLRARWAVPMFATVAAMGVLLLARETIFREARKPLGEASAPVVRPMAPPAPPPLTAPRAGGGGLSDQLPLPAESPAAAPAAELRPAALGKNERHRASVASASTSRKASADKGSAGRGREGLAPAPASSTAEKPAAKQKVAKSDLDDLLEGALSSGGRGNGTSAREPEAAANRAATKPASNDDLLSGVSRRSQRQAASEAAPAPRNSSAGGFAQPPPPAPAVTSVPAPAPAAKKAKAPRMRKESSDSAVMGDYERESPQAKDEAPAAAPSAASSSAEEASESDAEPKAGPDPAAPLMARAEGLMASRRWAEAAAAYRALIARFPRHEQVPNWKRRLSVVESAARQAPSGKGFATPPPPK